MWLQKSNQPVLRQFDVKVIILLMSYLSIKTAQKRTSCFTNMLIFLPSQKANEKEKDREKRGLHILK